MRKRDPGMLIVPAERRDEGERKAKEEQIKSEPLEFATVPRGERENEDDRDQLERVCVFAKKSDADEQSGGEPKPIRIRCPLEREPEREHGGDPEKDRKRIDRQEEVADVEERDGVKRDDRPKCHALAE